MREKGLLQMMTITTTILVAITCFSISASFFTAFGIEIFADESVKIAEQRFFRDSAGNLNVIGVVNNDGNIPVRVILGLNTTTNIDDDNIKEDEYISTTQGTTYGRIVYPSTASPFKFVVGSHNSVIDKTFILDIEKVPVPFYDFLVLNYSNMAVGDNKALVGTIRNVGPFDLHNISVYASVHSENRTQIDSVKSNLIPILKPGQELPFTAIPDSSIKGDILYFSCAGLDLDEPITTLRVDEDEFIPYDLQSIAKISSLKYENSTDSIAFGVKHYNPEGGDLSLKIPQLLQDQNIIVIMDDKVYEKAAIKMDGKTIFVDLFVPPGDHEMKIQGVRNRI